MARTTDLYTGQHVEWQDLYLGGTNTGVIDHVSTRTAWATVKLDCPYTLPARSDGAVMIEAQRITHTTLHASILTPRD